MNFYEEQPFYQDQFGDVNYPQQPNEFVGDPSQDMNRNIIIYPPYPAWNPWWNIFYLPYPRPSHPGPGPRPPHPGPGPRPPHPGPGPRPPHPGPGPRPPHPGPGPRPPR